MRTAHKVITVLIVLLGATHIAFTFRNYEGLSMDAFWFLGSGLAIVLAGFLNAAVLRDRGKDTVIWSLALITNVVFLILFAFASFMLREPQVYFGSALFFLTTLFSFVMKPKTE